MKRLITLLFAMIVLTACSGVKTIDKSYEYTFNGSGEYWKAEYSVNGKEVWQEKDGVRTTYSSSESDEFVLTYKGELIEISSLEYLKFSYETSVEGVSSESEFDEPPTDVSFKIIGESANGTKINGNEIIQVNVKWGDYEESFELHNINE